MKFPCQGRFKHKTNDVELFFKKKKNYTRGRFAIISNAFDKWIML